MPCEGMGNMSQNSVVQKRTIPVTPRTNATSPPISAIKMLGKKWTVQILQNLIPGIEHRHFSEIKNAIHGISPKMLSTRLKELQSFDIINRQVHPNMTPVGVSYSLTQKGWGVVPVSEELEQWKMKF